MFSWPRNLSFCTPRPPGHRNHAAPTPRIPVMGGPAAQLRREDYHHRPQRLCLLLERPRSRTRPARRVHLGAGQVRPGHVGDRLHTPDVRVPAGCPTRAARRRRREGARPGQAVPLRVHQRRVCRCDGEERPDVGAREGTLALVLNVLWCSALIDFLTGPRGEGHPCAVRCRAWHARAHPAPGVLSPTTRVSCGLAAPA